MLKLKLTALGHPNPDTFDINSEQEYRSVVVWLEDQKIRHYKIEERGALRNIESSTWLQAYDTYQKDLASPITSGSLTEQINWLVSFAVRLEYADNAAKYNEAKADAPKTAVPKVVSTNPLDNIDFSSPTFKQGVDRLCTLANIGPHPDHRVRLSALAKILKTSPHPSPASQDTNVVQKPTDVLKLLFLSDLRQLQTSINEALVAVQSVTADPKTDTSLGKVGF